MSFISLFKVLCYSRVKSTGTKAEDIEPGRHTFFSLKEMIEKRPFDKPIDGAQG